jgi:hypothetical protein
MDQAGQGRHGAATEPAVAVNHGAQRIAGSAGRRRHEALVRGLLAQVSDGSAGSAGPPCSQSAHRRCAYTRTSQHTSTVDLQVRRTTVDASIPPRTGWSGSNPGIETSDLVLTRPCPNRALGGGHEGSRAVHLGSRISALTSPSGLQAGPVPGLGSAFQARGAGSIPVTRSIMSRYSTAKKRSQGQVCRAHHDSRSHSVANCPPGSARCTWAALGLHAPPRSRTVGPFQAGRPGPRQHNDRIATA